MDDIILASTSPYRRVLLARLGVPFRCLAPLIDEDAMKGGDRAPRELAEHLALAKARSLCAGEPHATIIGSDQLVSFQGRILGKPGTAECAVDQLVALAGASHQLITSVAIWTREQIYTHTDTTTLAMRALSRAELERYVAADRPLDCAGSYKWEERGITLFDRIETEDSTAIVGLPLIALTSLLRGIGYRIP